MGVEGDDVRIAVTEAMNECVKEDILVDFFEQHREEVVEVSIYDYDEEEVRKVLVEEMAEELAEKAVKQNIISLVIKKVKKSKTLETIASELEEDEADIKPVYDAVIAAAPDYDIEKIKEKIIK